MQPREFYSAFMLLSLLIFVLARHFVPKPPALMTVPWQKRVGLALAAFIGGTLGAKLPFVLGESTGPFDFGVWIRDGKTITTGLIGAYLAVEFAKLCLDVRVKTGDTFALPLALALAVGRWGCFFNGCCYGVATDLPWGVNFGDGVSRHPTQVYESLFHLTMAVLLLVLLVRGTLPRQHLKVYLIAYGVYRFLTEFLRPEPASALGLTFYQWVSLALIVGLTMQWLLEAQPLWRRATPQPGV